MAASCATCGRPITKQTRFVIVGCEVVHRSCVPLLSTQGTEGQRLQQRVADLDVRLGSLGSIVEDEQRRNRNREVKIAELEMEVQSLRRREAQAVEQLRANQRGAQRAHQHVTDALTAAHADLERAIAERDAARNEAALHQTIKGDTNTTTEKIDEKKVDDRDSTSVRFGLLEFD